MDIAAGRPRVSFFGDLHPSFAGNVVKAMGSAKQGYPVVVADARARGRAGLGASDAEISRRGSMRELRATRACASSG